MDKQFSENTKVQENIFDSFNLISNKRNSKNGDNFSRKGTAKKPYFK